MPKRLQEQSEEALEEREAGELGPEEQAEVREDMRLGTSLSLSLLKSEPDDESAMREASRAAARDRVRLSTVLKGF